MGLKPRGGSSPLQRIGSPDEGRFAFSGENRDRMVVLYPIVARRRALPDVEEPAARPGRSPGLASGSTRGSPPARSSVFSVHDGLQHRRSSCFRRLRSRSSGSPSTRLTGARSRAFRSASALVSARGPAVRLTPSAAAATLIEHMFAEGGPVLTDRQRQILDFLTKYVDAHGYPPTVREIGEAVGLASPSTVHAHLANLERAGLLKRDPTKPRAIELRREPKARAGADRRAQAAARRRGRRRRAAARRGERRGVPRRARAALARAARSSSCASRATR